MRGEKMGRSIRACHPERELSGGMRAALAEPTLCIEDGLSERRRYQLLREGTPNGKGPPYGPRFVGPEWDAPHAVERIGACKRSRDAQKKKKKKKNRLVKETEAIGKVGPLRAAGTRSLLAPTACTSKRYEETPERNRRQESRNRGPPDFPPAQGWPGPCNEARPTARFQQARCYRCSSGKRKKRGRKLASNSSGPRGASGSEAPRRPRATALARTQRPGPERGACNQGPHRLPAELR
ncbi:hypothetical protein HPB47_011350 [Ixodes persulcatus]|uniref:Uncharacterized protein n=1 Tax=Ixodes persulcatus TaxID=34615 RepID=A0AC60NWN8_IXOPE|nr:hypothetical protein HPB47_011350 [Ixodes persulcatus]